MLKTLKSSVIAICVALTMTLTGCVSIGTDISEFEVPPKLTAAQQEITKALEKSVGENYTLKYPLSGIYRSAFVRHKLDKTSESNAVAFYTPSSGSDGPHIAILNKENTGWRVTTDIISQGNEIDSIDFGDFDGDGNEEIVVGWRSFNSTDLTLFVYSKKNGSYTIATKFGTFTKMKTLDMDGDGKKDILLFELNSDPKKAMARLISFRDGSLQTVSSTPLDSTVTSYADAYVTRLQDDKTGVLIDGYKSKDKMITELVYYEKTPNGGSLKSPFYNLKRKTVNSTLRNVTYQSTDINNDGVVDIPLAYELPSPQTNSDKKQRWLVHWSDYDTSGNLSTKLDAIMNYNQGYYLIYPEKWDGKVTVSTETDDTAWNFCKWDSENMKYDTILFTIKVFHQDIFYQQQDKSYYTVLAQDKGIIYAVHETEGISKDKYALTPDEIKQSFKLIKQ